MSSMVEIDTLTKRFGTITAVNGISLEVARGEVLGFLGPNGAGKSTTMKMLTGFLSPDGGKVRIGGDDIEANPIAVKRRLGYLPEGAPLYGDMTPAAFLDFIAQTRGLSGADKARRIGEVVERVNIGDVMAQPTETLSKGFKRRVGLAQAILHDPEVLILDEPTDGLDPNQKHEVRQLIREMSADKVIILSTHILEEVDAVCSRAVIIARGELLADGTPEQLLSQSGVHNAVRLEISGVTAEVATAALTALERVASVTVKDSDDERLVLLAHPAGNQDVTSDIGALARENG
ncbi:MAG: ABC-2 type transport system ATP-binding protein, partial [Gammaproteobacteria bacterium]